MNFLTNSLPNYEGKYNVGFLDIEATPKQFEKPAVLARVFYPTDKGHAKGSNWLPNNWSYAFGYGDFLHIPSAAIALIMYPVLTLTRKKASLNAPLAAAREKYPVILFSHGLGGMRTTYSQLCGNLASRGFIVASIEHADGSAAFTSRLNESVKIPHYHPQKEDLREGEDVNAGLLRVRTKQVTQRRDEIVSLLELLKEINNGNFSSLLPTSDRNKNACVSQLSAKMDLEQLGIAGHSFGGASVIKVLATTSIKFKCAITLDPWMFSVQDCQVKNIPVLNLQSSSFHWTSNMDAMQKMQKNSSFHKDSIFGHIRESSHQDASDLGLLFPFLMTRIKQSGPLAPQKIHLIQEKIIREFIGQYFPDVNVDYSRTKSASLLHSEHAVFGDDSWNELRSNIAAKM